ncbi:gliding motility-associated C-terminal domain-containing protein [Siccationidurans ginsengisoli]|nr:MULTISPECIES: gliding motility-associated C-terminal domain-containing protein [unclassified Hymenobacter]MBO2032879.1 gliding motility-associated C-terminal domain-containing protein [Hymenobacter sp. BT559]
MPKNFYVHILCLLVLSLPGWAQTSPPLPAAPPDTAPSLEFVANKGQWPAAVRYAAAVPGGHLCLEPGGLRYILLQPIEHPHAKTEASPARSASAKAKAAAASPGTADTNPIKGHQLRVRFAGADAATPLEPSQATGEVRNYLHGNDPSQWARAVLSYRQVRYQAPWPGIAARFYENGTQHLEYDFEVAAGADASRVQLRYEGASSLILSDDGQLHIGTSVGALTELAPHAYQLDPATGQHQAVACRYRLRSEEAQVSFELGAYDHRRPLVIDPTVVFSTYSGAKGSNWGFTATYDAAGNMYSGGIVLDDLFALPSYPTTPGAFQTSFAAVIDIALIKYNTAVNGPASRVWATYLGGNRADFPSSLVVNAQNELIVLGSTSSTNYPTTSDAVQRGFAGGLSVDPFGPAPADIYRVSNGTDIVVTRLSADGGSLAASTYLGGSGNDGIAAYNPASAARQLPQNYGDALRGDVLTDAQGNIYVASVSGSSNFPTTASFGPSYRGGTCDAVVVKLPAALNRLTWSGYLGGSAADAAYSIQLDPSGNAYVGGGTLSTGLPSTASGYQASAQGNVDGFVARIAADGGAVQRATYLGTSSYDQVFFVQLGSDGGVYVLGQTLGTWPVSAGVYSNPNSRQFIRKLGPDLDKSLMSSVIGSGSATIDFSPTAFLVDQCDRIYACGWGGQVNKDVYTYPGFLENNGYTDRLPTTANAVRRVADTPGAGSDFYLAQYAPNMASLSYATFYGDPTPYSEGDHVDGGTSRFDPRGVVYAAACSCFNRNGFPVPPGANTYATVNGAVSYPTYGMYLCNNAAFKLNFEPASATVGNDQAVCVNSPALALRGQPGGGIWTGPGVSGSAAGGFVFTPSPALAGAQVLTYTVPGATAACTASAKLTITVDSPVPAAATAQASVCAGSGPLALTGGSPAGGTWTGPGVSGSVAGGFVFTPTLALVGPQQLTYTVTSTAACGGGSSRAAVTIEVLAAPTVVLPPDTVLCPGRPQAFRLRASPAGGVWSGPGVSAGNVFTPPALPGITVLTYTVNAGTACPVVATRRITLLAQPVLAPVLVPGPCAPSNVAPLVVHFNQPTAGLPPDAVLTWNFGDDSTAVTGLDVTHTYLRAGTFRPRVTLSYNQNRCGQTLGLPPVTVLGMFVPNVFTPNSDQQNDFFAPRIGGCPPRLQVFSRWGQQVYENAAYQNTWDGDGLAPGIYYYLLSPPDGSPAVKGWVELVR